MVTNLLFKGKYSVEVYKDKFTLGTDINSTKEVPFLRFRLDGYGGDIVTYIESMLDRFKYSVGLCELSVTEHIMDDLANLQALDGKVAKLLHIDVTDTDVAKTTLSDELNTILDNVISNGYRFDRVVMQDNSTTLNPVSITILKKQIASKLGINERDIGVCGSPFSFDSSSCLTAEMARDIISLYGYDRDVKIPSANHQSMDCCSCIRHYEITGDVAYTGKKGSNTGGNKTNGRLENLCELDVGVITGTDSSGSSERKPKAKKKMSKAPIEWV